MASTHVLGLPRIGAQRELKFALESFWRRELDESDLLECGRQIREKNWNMQSQAGLDWICVGDFAWYDQVLSTLALLGALPTRFGFQPQKLSLHQYFTLARGNVDHHAMEMTKWFDTNYHYLVPEWSADVNFDGGVDWLFDELAQAQSHGHRCKVVLLGPLSLLYLGKIKSGLTHKLDLLPRLITAYQRVLKRLQAQGVQWVQLDEPILALDLDQSWRDAFSPSYTALREHAPSILLASYFGDVHEHAELLRELPIDGLHLDLVRGTKQLPHFLETWPSQRVLSLGVIDGRNIWRADLDAKLDALKPVQQQLGDRLWVASSCSLLHVPVDLSHEIKMDADLKGWLAFTRQKLDELSALRDALQGKDTVELPCFAQSRSAREARQKSTRIHNTVVQRRVASTTEADATRSAAFSERCTKQRDKWQLPLFPTTTIGSFPQTTTIRHTRAAYKRNEIGHLEYLEAMRNEIRIAVERQEELGLDVLVHGEAERNDMVEYFGEQLWGYGFSENGWVQSYGSRCVKPPFIYGDVYRVEPMTVGWSQFAQSLTDKPMKGMLTGPVTMLQWSFVRDDQARETTALQIALALRDEVRDLEKAGIAMIQVDEPAFREGLPLKRSDWPQYLTWAVRAFKISTAGVADDTQIHTHMCYSEFNDILPWIAALDADVITIETSRSDMELLTGFGEFDYPNDIGPGVYDIHSPRVPTVDEIVTLLQKARTVIPDARLWINPDCGLKTRAWPETQAALVNMVEAARHLRADALAESDCNAI